MHLTAENLVVHYRGSDGQELPALGPISFHVEDQTFVCLLGPSGCGKSTLIRVFAGLQRATGGVARLGGEPVRSVVDRTAVMFQSANLMPWRTVRDNIALPLEIAGASAIQRRDAVDALLPMLGLQGFDGAYPGELSGGMAQRAALGRVLIQQPDLLLLDEPFGALDALTREQISLDLLSIWTQQRQTVLMVTHDINEAVLLADRVLVMSRRPGRLLADIPVDLARPRQLEMVYTTPFVETARAVRSAIDRSQ